MAHMALTAHRERSGGRIVDYLEIARRAAAEAATDDGDLVAVLRGRAIELWSDAAGQRIFIVADERDAALLNERRGEVLTVDELRLVVKITDPASAAEVLRWKRTFDGSLCKGSSTNG